MAKQPSSQITDTQYSELKSSFPDTQDRNKLYRHIVNAPFSDKLLVTSIDLGIAVLLLADLKNNTLDRVALSDTELAQGAVKVSAKPFHDIKIPLNTERNIIVQSIKTGEYRITEDWQYLFTPALTSEEARLNQAGASIECSLVWPLDIKNGGAMIFSFYQPQAYITEEHLSFARRYTEIVSEKLNQLSD